MQLVKRYGNQRENRERRDQQQRYRSGALCLPGLQVDRRHLLDAGADLRLLMGGVAGAAGAETGCPTGADAAGDKAEAGTTLAGAAASAERSGARAAGGAVSLTSIPR